MNLTSELFFNLARAILLGALVAAILWLLRGRSLVRRVWLTASALAITFSVYWLAPLPGDVTGELIQRMALAASILLGVQLATQLFDVVVWEGFIAHRRHGAVPRLLVDLFNFAALIITALVLLNRLFSVDLSGLLVTSTVLSAVLGLALQDMLGNVIAGLALQLERPFEVGEWIRMHGQEEGQVTQMNWRTLTLLTRDHHQIILPNSVVAKTEVINYSRPTKIQRMKVRIGIGYDVPPTQVKDVLVRAAAEVEGVLAEPQPRAGIESYGDFAIYYLILYWIEDYTKWPAIHDAMLTRVWYGLRRAGLHVPYPTQHHITRELTDDHEEQSRARLRREIFAELRELAVFAPLNDQQIETLARSAVIHRYAAGETLVRQGDPGDSLFTIKQGKVRVEVRKDKAQTATIVDTIGSDGFFGEMSLLTGEPRSASIVAEEETEVVVVHKEAFAEILKDDSSLPDALSRTLQQRLKNAAARAAMWDAIMDPKQGDQQTALMRRIRGFFGIRQ